MGKNLPNVHPQEASQRAADAAMAAERQRAADELRGQMAADESRVESLAASTTERTGDRSPR